MEEDEGEHEAEHQSAEICNNVASKLPPFWQTRYDLRGWKHNFDCIEWIVIHRSSIRSLEN